VRGERTAKLVVDLQRGVLEIDASDQFVDRVYTDVRDTILSKLASGSSQDEIDGDQVAEKPTGSDTGKKTRRRTRAGGPSCASRIEAVKEEGFFKEPKGAGDVRAKLKERGTTYPSKNVAAALNNLTKAGKLRRFDENGWKYQNP
jgi:hypothetical protein